MSENIVTDLSVWCENGHDPKIMHQVMRDNESELDSELRECPECGQQRIFIINIHKTKKEVY